MTLLLDALPPIALPLPLALLLRAPFPWVVVPLFALLLLGLCGRLCLGLWVPLAIRAADRERCAAVCSATSEALWSPMLGPVGARPPFVRLLVDAAPPFALPLPVAALLRALSCAVVVPSPAPSLVGICCRLCLGSWALLCPLCDRSWALRCPMFYRS